MSYEKYIPKEILDRYETWDYKHAAAILANEFPKEFKEICDVLKKFRFSKEDILASGGNESNIPKRFSSLLGKNWAPKNLSAEMLVDGIVVKMDTHKIDYCQGRVAFDLEWNSKDQTFDRDLYAFRAFYEYDRISVGVIVTRSEELNDLFKSLGIMSKYGASTTWTGKLLPRLNAGRNGGCQVLVFGITSKLVG